MTAGVTVAIVNEESHKGEDASSTMDRAGVLAYGVFDGHGGKHCSQACASNGPSGILPMILSAMDGSTLPSDTAVTDAFWTADAAIGADMLLHAERPHAGSTATILCLAPGKSADADFECLLAWVGDSTGIVVDMQGAGRLAHVSRNHSPDVMPEVDFLHHLAAVAKQVRKKRKKEADGGAGGDDDDDGADGKGEHLEIPPSTDEVEDALRALKKPMDDAALVHRALVREKLIMSHIPKGGKYRRNVCVYRRPIEKDANEPLAIATTLDPYSSHHRDLQMSRSICDWTKTSWILPHPEIQRFSLSPSACTRIVLASDGLWDVTSHAHALQMVRAASSCTEAANALLAHAHHVYCDERQLDRPGDDTTVMVIEVNPNAVEWTPPPASQIPVEEDAAGCCLLS
mmetsp:Transcript_30584/g.79406  ORF Transcript_30584/g.79406 Transcript_30584/m.79406 type:complete len:401 (+) Transcript_30584:74-1276(+)